MSSTKNCVCALILKHHFGEVVSQVGEYLMQKGGTPLPFILRDTGLKLSKVKYALATLVQHNMCSHYKNARGGYEYLVDQDMVLLRNRLPQFIYSAKLLFGDAAEVIVEEVVNHGRAQMSVTCQRVANRLHDAAAMDETGKTKELSLYEIRDKFEELVKTQFLQRCRSLDAGKDEDEEDLYVIPKVDFSKNRKRKRVSGGGGDNPSKKLKLESQSDGVAVAVVAAAEDEGIVWRVNVQRFNLYQRDQAIIAAVTRKIDKRTGSVVRTMLQMSETRSPAHAPYTNPLSAHEIFKELPADLGIENKQILDQVLKIATEDSLGFIQKVDDSGGGMYSIHFKKALEALATAHIESVVNERFGTKGLRIFRLLLLKKQLEQKTVEERVMMAMKEVKELMLVMTSQDFLYISEITKATDYHPSSTFYLYSVNVRYLCRMLQDRAYTMLYNLIRRREFETKKHKRLLDKKQRVEAIKESLRIEGADPQQIAEVEETITPTENATINKVINMNSKLEVAEIQVDEALMIFTLFNEYSLMKT